MYPSASLLALALPVLIIASAAGSPDVDGSIEKLLSRVSNGKRNGDGNLMAKRDTKQKLGRRWVWGATIIQDDTPTAGLPAPGVNANLFSSALPVNTPTAIPVAPVFPTKAASSSSLGAAVVLPSKAVASNKTTNTTLSSKAAATTLKSSSVAFVNASTIKTVLAAVVTARPSASTSITPKLVKVSRAHALSNPKGHKFQKKWVWGTSIIQDGDSAPAPSANTPAAVPTAPVFPTESVLSAVMEQGKAAVLLVKADGLATSTATATPEKRGMKMVKREKRPVEEDDLDEDCS